MSFPSQRLPDAVRRKLLLWRPILVLVLIACAVAPARVRTGAEVLLDSRLDLLRGRRVGLITNQTGVLPSGETLISALRTHRIVLSALFTPEHGLTGSGGAGEVIGDTTALGIPVYSLYGKNIKPTPAMLADVDVLVYDLQDVGTRFYTYITTMTLAMEAAAERAIPFIVLDRPNPLGGLTVDGPMRSDSLRSFVGWLPTPVVYGLTCGELAQMIAGEHWLRGTSAVRLTVVPMEGWKRSMTWHATGLPWRVPSPSLPTVESALAYPVTCFLEATNISEGRGTAAPFVQCGAPFLDAGRLLSALRSSAPGGFRWDSVSFRPSKDKFAGSWCRGVAVSVARQDGYRPVEASLHLLVGILRVGGKRVVVNEKTLAGLYGSADPGRALQSGRVDSKLLNQWARDARTFRDRSLPYLLYR